MATAKIQYTIDLEEIPYEMRKRFSFLSNSANEIQTKLNALATNKQLSALETCKDIEKLRTELVLLDHNLGDCYNALVGYANYQTSLLKQQEKEQNEPAGD